uniref:Reverse transcriptase zinc-binding domain-containing protein n=1 Tax=Aegilops tauschii subsp. strangulata TaxID=200361 RepID=A0A453NMC6_AEGTS
MITQLGCPVVELPITYLGIPLTLRRPSAAQLQPLVDSVAARLPTCKAWLMNKAGRLALVKSVLSAIPVHQLLAFTPPKKTLKQLEKIQRGFLWAGRAVANEGHCHVNWRHACRPVEYGGLGIRCLERAGLALRLRWMWLARTDTDRAWKGLDLQFSKEERALFFASTTMVLGDGRTTLFWDDRWINGQSVREIAPMLYQCIPKRRRKTRTVAEGLGGNTWARDIQGTLRIHEIGQYLMMDGQRHILGPVLLRRHIPGIYPPSFLEADLEELGATPRQILPLACQPRRCWTASRLARRGL